MIKVFRCCSGNHVIAAVVDTRRYVDNVEP